MRVRSVVNTLTLATPVGRLLARIDGASLLPGPHGTLVAAGYRSRFPAPRASAVTIGDVVLCRLDADQLTTRPALLEHEARHAHQWAKGLGMLGFPLLYGLASAWSFVRYGDPALGNAFERRAGLVDGGYLAPGASVEVPLSRRRRRRARR